MKGEGSRNIGKLKMASLTKSKSNTLKSNRSCILKIIGLGGIKANGLGGIGIKALVPLMLRRPERTHKFIYYTDYLGSRIQPCL